MFNRKFFCLATAASFASIAIAAAQTPSTPQDPPAAPAAPASVSLPVPSMAGPLSFSPTPPSYNAGPLGTWYVDGVASAIGFVQNNPVASDKNAAADITNAQIILQKIDGMFRFYAQIGGYALPSLGQPYAHTATLQTAAQHLFGPVPQAFVKFAPSENVSLQAGELPTLIGAEYTFSFENVNIERGLLWSQEPAISRGIQANYITGPLAFSLSLNDGFFSNHYSWLSGAATWSINPANQLVFAGGANLSPTATNSLATPRVQNNSSIWNAIYTYTKGPLMVTPYLQYSQVSKQAGIAIQHPASLYGAAVLASYAFTPSFTLGARSEYEASIGGAGRSPTNYLYGPASSAASFTLTPTYTHGHWFARADLSPILATHTAAHAAFGPDGNTKSQLRTVLEIGYIF